MSDKVSFAQPNDEPERVISSHAGPHFHDPDSGIEAKRIVFLGGLLLESQREEIERCSLAGVQYAADALQRALLKGLIQFSDLDVRLVNVPYVGSYPKTYRKVWFPAVTDVLFGTVPVSGMGFFNLMVLRDHSRQVAAFRGLLPAVEGAGDCVIVAYSAHLPFIRAALRCQRRHPAVRICAVVPDLIEHMDAYSGLRKLIAQRRGSVFRKLARKIDYFVVLTRHMAEPIGVGPDKHVVVEGIHDAEPGAPDGQWPVEPGPIFIYTGTLAERYGILDLLEAFSHLEVATARLWICGAGDAENTVKSAALHDSRVTFHGRVPRADAIALQSRAHVMVNPRRPEGEFTRYSFPSKTMEYLASGRPVVMHWLPGIPEEYRPHLISPETGDAAGLSATLQQVVAMSQDDLRRIGAAGREFVLTRKTPRMQIAKLLAGLFPGWHGSPQDAD